MTLRSTLPRAAGALSLAFALAASPDTLSAQVGPDGQPIRPPVPMVITSGRGEVEVAPDKATIHLAVEARGSTAAAAASQNARIQTAVLDTLRRMGYTQEQLGTLGYSVQPEYQYPKEGGVPKVVGYVARNTIRVNVSRIERVGATIDAALAKGATNVAGLRFESSRFDEMRREALKNAVRAARADAEAMASAAGGTLGELMDVTSMDQGPMPYMEMAQAPMAMARGADMVQTPIVPGEQKVTVMVMARWRYSSAR